MEIVLDLLKPLTRCKARTHEICRIYSHAGSASDAFLRKRRCLARRGPKVQNQSRARKERVKKNWSFKDDFLKNQALAKLLPTSNVTIDTKA